LGLVLLRVGWWILLVGLGLLLVGWRRWWRLTFNGGLGKGDDAEGQENQSWQRFVDGLHIFVYTCVPLALCALFLDSILERKLLMMPWFRLAFAKNIQVLLVDTPPGVLSCAKSCGEKA
jgi:hypothetical protein